MNPALIDLHVRLGEGRSSAPADLAAAALEVGLDGLVVVGRDLAPPVACGEHDGVALFCGVELDSDVGRLICVPAVDDEWFRNAGWRSLFDGEAGYASAAIVHAFGERGGAVLVAQPFDRDLDHPACEEAFTATPGFAGVVVTSSPRHSTSNDRAQMAARGAGLPGVGGSASGPGDERFGGVATVFAEPPVDQATLAAALRSGRLWPAEIVALPPAMDDGDDEGDDEGEGAGPAANGNVAAPGARKAERATARSGNRKEAGEFGASRKTERADKADKVDRGATRQRKTEREDNRGNRLDPAMLRKPAANAFDERQPEMDPIARLYGHGDRRPEGRLSHLSDSELDRINGNRARGPDPNVMATFDFREMRAERAHVNLLLEVIAGQTTDERDSLALRFAMSALHRVAEAEGVSPVAAAEQLVGGQGGDANRRKRRRRRS